MTHRLATKAQGERRHAKQRALERYGVTLNRHQLRELSRLIQLNHTSVRFLWKESNRVSHFALTFNEQRYIVVYDRQRKTIVTFLPPEAESQYVDGRNLWAEALDT